MNQSEIEFGSKCEMLPFSSVFPARNFCLKDWLVHRVGVLSIKQVEKTELSERLKMLESGRIEIYKLETKPNSTLFRFKLISLGPGMTSLD